MINVAWLNRHNEPGHISRGFWDQGILEAALAGELAPIGFSFAHAAELPPEGGAVVVLPARWHEHDLDWVQEQIGRLEWCLLILTGDEESVFPAGSIRHPRLRLWIQTPRSLPEGAFALEDGWPPQTPRRLRRWAGPAARRPLDWAFAGQINNGQRQDLAAALAQMSQTGRFRPTEGFGAGLPHWRYLRLLAAAKTVPCPSGNFTPDTFRLFEALEAGCLPIAAAQAPNRPDDQGYWEMLYGEPPFPILKEWAELPSLMPELLEAWPQNASRCFAWWQMRKREIACRLEADLTELNGSEPRPSSLITALVPTSPIPSHPSLAIIKETIRSIRAQLPEAEILVMIDGCRPEQQHLAQAYAEYERRLLWWINHQPGIFPIRAGEFRHQAAMTREALRYVRTPLILFCEHDTPLEPAAIPWERLERAILGGEANLIRFHHETQIPAEHGYLMLDLAPKEIMGAPLVPTRQWSQRPHLASASLYRRILEEHFSAEARSMIEDRMHGVLQHGEWERFRCWIFHPEGSIKRSRHLDGRAGEPKFEGSFVY